MSQLAKLQADFQAYILDNEKGAGFKTAIIDDKTVGVTTRLGIYSDGYRLRIIEVLSNVYPKLKEWLGDDEFDKIARSYIDQYPSQYRNMRWVGDQMAEHLNNTLPQTPIAAEIASFEWALGLAFDAEDAPTLQLAHLTNLAPEDWASIPLNLHPSFYCLPLKWNVAPIWHAMNAEETPPEATKTNEACIVWRQEMNAFYRSIDDQEESVLNLVMTGINFGELCEHLANQGYEDATEQAANYLVSWLNAEMLLKTV